MKVFVTGGAGFIASHIADAVIKNGHEAVVVDNLATGKKENVNPRARFYNVDIRNLPELEKVFTREKPDIVNHHCLMRDFEVPACGAMYLVQRYPGIGVHYLEDEEVVAWSTLDELKAKIDYYLTHENKRQSIAAAGRERVVRTHRWEHRYRTMISHPDGISSFSKKGLR